MTRPKRPCTGALTDLQIGTHLDGVTTRMHDRTDQWAVPLDGLSSVSWTGGVQVDALMPLDTLVVQTRNSCYEITIVAPSSGEVLIRGGQFFPEPTRAIVSGSTIGGSCLKVRGIYKGFLLELLSGGQTIVTTDVQSVSKTGHPSVH